MVDETRATINDLIAIYEFEPNLRDIYVEGESDADILKWLSLSFKTKNTKVYCISNVQVDSDLVPEDESGNRGRVIGLANELTKESSSYSKNILCVIDKDFDDFLDKNHDSEYIKCTDYANMEMYLYNKIDLQKFFEIALRKEYKDKIYEQLSTTLQEIFLVRLTKKFLYNDFSWVEFGNCCTLTKNNDLVFDTKKFVSILIDFHQYSDQVCEFIEHMDSFRPKLNEDYRYQIHGHDLICLLTWYAKKIKVKKDLCNIDSITSAFRMNINYQEFSEFPLMKNLIDWAEA